MVTNLSEKEAIKHAHDFAYGYKTNGVFKDIKYRGKWKSRMGIGLSSVSSDSFRTVSLKKERKKVDVLVKEKMVHLLPDMCDQKRLISVSMGRYKRTE